MLTVVFGTLLIWIGWFALMLVPAYWVCRWWVPAPQPKPHPIVYLALTVMFGMYSELAALIVTIIVMLGELFVFGPSPSLALFMNDLRGFGVALMTTLVFVPTFAALVVGYRKLKREVLATGQMAGVMVE